MMAFTAYTEELLRGSVPIRTATFDAKRDGKSERVTVVARQTPGDWANFGVIVAKNSTLFSRGSSAVNTAFRESTDVFVRWGLEDKLGFTLSEPVIRSVECGSKRLDNLIGLLRGQRGR